MQIQDYLTCAIQNIQVLITKAAGSKRMAVARVLAAETARQKAILSLRHSAKLFLSHYNALIPQSFLKSAVENEFDCGSDCRALQTHVTASKHYHGKSDVCGSYLNLVSKNLFRATARVDLTISPLSPFL